ncbi:hypothetical protein IGJ55_003339 [Enterococcus sp. AZ170]
MKDFKKIAGILFTITLTLIFTKKYCPTTTHQSEQALQKKLQQLKS